MKIQYDKQADALYIYLGERRLKKTVRAGENILVDLDPKDGIVGVEFYKISRSMPKENSNCQLLPKLRKKLPKGSSLRCG